MNIKETFEDFVFRLSHKNPIYINAYVCRDKDNVANKNWGDDINYWFLKDIIKEEFRIYNESPLAFRINSPNYLVIGSTISLLTKANSIIWGAGCIDERNLPAIPKKIYAVRGPLTRNFLLSKGIDCPDVYGDPAMLLPRYYKPNVEKKHKLGLIHHVSENPMELEGAHLISMCKYDKWTEVIDDICSCEYIASSSLHGLIVAEAYGIPNVWIESKKIIGGHFKFNDFYLSINPNNAEAPIPFFDNISSDYLIGQAALHGGEDFNSKPLIESAPFELCNLSNYK